AGARAAERAFNAETTVAREAGHPPRGGRPWSVANFPRTSDAGRASKERGPASSVLYGTSEATPAASAGSAMIAAMSSAVRSYAAGDADASPSAAASSAASAYEASA